MNDTLATYDALADLYAERTPSVLPDDLKEWLDRAVEGLDPEEAAIFEIGSGTGRDATYLCDDLDYAVLVSDAAPSFVRMLEDAGFDAMHFNVVVDQMPSAGYIRREQSWDLVFADAVLLHLTRSEFIHALVKVYNGLVDGGRFAFTVKEGVGQEVSQEKLGSPRFFRYWQVRELEYELEEAGFATWDIVEHPGWIHVVAVR